MSGDILCMSQVITQGLQFLDNAAATAQGEIRWNVYRRWHLSAFAGAGWIGDTIRDIGSEMYTRLVTFGEHLAKIGRSLNSSVDAYNKATASFDSRVLPGARKFTELGISAKKEIPDIEQVEHMARRVESREENDKPH